MKKLFGYVLIFHCLPQKIDPSVAAYWIDLRRKLNKKNLELVIVSVSEIVGADFPVIYFPFNLKLLESRFDPRRHWSIVPEDSVEYLAAWYKIEKQSARKIVYVYWGLLESLIEAIKPIYVVSWQSQQPLSKSIKYLCCSKGIPWAAAERGWLKNTLMLDQQNNHVLSEIFTSLTTQRLFEKYEPSEKILKEIEHRRNSQSLSRYQIVINERLEEIQKSKLYAKNKIKICLFLHGEPQVDDLEIVQPNVTSVHGAGEIRLHEVIHEMASELRARNGILYIKEHPLNRRNLADKFKYLNDVIEFTELSAEHLVELCDATLYTLSTLQYDVALMGKKIGVIYSSLLTNMGGIPSLADFRNASEFLDVVLSQSEAEVGEETIKFFAFLMEFVLIDISPDKLDQSASYGADFFNKFIGKPPCVIEDRVVYEWMMQNSEELNKNLRVR